MTVRTQPFPAKNLSDLFAGASSPVQSAFNTPTLDRERAAGNIQRPSKSIPPREQGFNTDLPVAAESGKETAPVGDQVVAGIPINLIVIGLVIFAALALLR